MAPIFEQIAQFFAEFLAAWGGYWQGFNSFFETFAHFGIGELTNSINHYGTAPASPTTIALGFLYTVARLLPSMVLIYFVVRKLFPQKTKWVAVAVAVLYRILDIVMFGYVLGTKPLPTETFTTISHGPTTIFHVLSELWVHDKQHLFVVASAFITFFILSFMLFYVLNFVLWFITLTFRERPLFSETSGKGHALWLTMIWTFYLALVPAGIAMINTLVIFAVVVLNRSDMGVGNKAKKAAKPIQRKVSENPEYDEQVGGTQVIQGPPPENFESSGKDRIEWVEE